MKKYTIKSESNKPVFDKTNEVSGVYYYMGWIIFIQGDFFRACKISFSTGNFGNDNIESVLKRATHLIDEKERKDELASKNYKENLLKKIERALF